MSENLYGVVTAPEWLQGPVGPQGIPGKDGKDGKPGPAGKDATINGLPTVELKAGKNVNIQQSGDVLTISATGGGGGTGENGTTFTPAVSQDGVISWTNDGGLSNPDPVNIKGPEGKEGPIGKTGPAGRDGKDGTNGADGQPGKDGAAGANGKSAYQLAVDNGYSGTEQEWLASLKGTDGKNGTDGEPGKNGIDGADGKDGTAGKDATINGVNTLTMVQGDNITLSQSGNELTISATGGGGADVPIATTAIAGKVKPDGTSITVTADGTISSVGGGGSFELGDRIKAGTGTKSLMLGEINASNQATAIGTLTVGYGAQATANRAMAMGFQAKAQEQYSIAMGHNALAKNKETVAIGNQAKASGDGAIAIGGFAEAGDPNAFAWNAGEAQLAVFGQAHGMRSVAIGQNTLAKGDRAFAQGHNTIASGNAQHVEGKWNLEDTSSTYAHIVGNGASGANDNAYTLDWLGNGTFKGKVSSQGADYAEYFEWLDGNPEAEDRVGYIVTLDGNKIRKANAGEDVLGIISGTVGVLGDNYEWNWNGKYLTDDFGRVLYDMVEEFSEDEDGTKHSVGFFPHPRINPAYNPDEEYVNRANRPEWDAVGMMGKLYVRDDGTCAVNSYAAVGVEGVATASAEKTNMRVVERIKPNIVRVVLK